MYSKQYQTLIVLNISIWICFKSHSEITQFFNYVVASNKFHLAHTHIQTLLMHQKCLPWPVFAMAKPIVALSPCVSVHFHDRFCSLTGCIHLLKCIKWKSSSICMKRGPRLKGFGEVMLFIHHEVMVFFTVTLWPPMSLSTPSLLYV